jgi:hypothetical protein
MSESKQTIAKLFVAFADALNSMDNREFDLLIQGKAKLRLVERPKARENGKLLDTDCLEETLSEVAQKLNAAESREVAESLLAAINQPRRKDFLLLLAKACNVSVGSKDSIAMIERQLIENIVGARLASEAIQKVAF